MSLSFGSEAGGLTPIDLAMGLPAAVALACYAVAALPGERRAAALRTALLLAWIAHGISLLVDVAGLASAQPGIRFGFAPALSVTLWLVVAVYEFESRLVPLHGARRALASVGVVVVVLASVYPGQLHPLAVSPWAPLHWLLGIASYGLFGVAVMHAVLLSRAERRLRSSPLAASAESGGVPILHLERLTFRFVAAGFIALTAAIVLGGASETAWHWDHKTVFSILGWIVFAGLLAGRRTFGWRGPRAAGWLYAGAALLLLAYVGSRFVLEVVLHRPPAA